MADTGSPLAPGLFQGNVDAIQGFEKYINDNGGIGCRKLKVETWDSKLTPDEAKNGQINACTNALAMVGGNSLFNPDVTDDEHLRRQGRRGHGHPGHGGAGQRHQRAVRPERVHHPGHRRDVPAGWRRAHRQPAVHGVRRRPRSTTRPSPRRCTGLFMVPGDLPTTVQSATYQILGPGARSASTGSVR